MMYEEAIKGLSPPADIGNPSFQAEWLRQAVAAIKKKVDELEDEVLQKVWPDDDW